MCVRVFGETSGGHYSKAESLFPLIIFGADKELKQNFAIGGVFGQIRGLEVRAGDAAYFRPDHGWFYAPSLVTSGSKIR
jgi:hypothetical protein